MASAALTPDLSLVVPVYNEGRILRELISRCLAAARETGLAFELIVVDDASADETAAIGVQFRNDPAVRFHRNERNLGQFAATQEGLRRSRGAIVVVLDGDLQDPPELIPQLVSRFRAMPGDRKVVFGCKRSGNAQPLNAVGRKAFHWLQAAFSGLPVPGGIGSYCALSAGLAARVSQVPLRTVNLGAVCATLDAERAYVPYDQAKRYDGNSRVGTWGLVQEALASMTVTGTTSRLFYFLAAVSWLGGSLPAAVYRRPAAAAAGAALGALMLVAGIYFRKRSWRGRETP